MDADLNTRWQKEPNGDYWLGVELQGRKAMGGLQLEWDEPFPDQYDIETSPNGINWASVYAARGRGGGRHEILLPETEARFLRILCRDPGDGKAYRVRRLELSGPDAAWSPELSLAAAALRHRGCYPRWLTNEQAYWTLAGTLEDVAEAALFEDGTLEPHKRGFTLMPILRVGDRLVTRENAAVTQSLAQDCLPLPSVHWDWNGLRLDVTLFCHGGERSSAFARYTLSNRSAAALRGRFYLVLHPIQGYPPWQGGTDGFSPVRQIAYENGVIRLDGGRRVGLLTLPDAFAAKGGPGANGRSGEGDIADDIALDRFPSAASAEDPAGFASGSAVYAFTLAPGESRRFFACVPLHDAPLRLGLDANPASVERQFEEMLAAQVRAWEPIVDRVRIDVPDPDLVNTLRANVAYTFVTRDGPAFQPGSRSYDKTWIRDGGDAAIAALRMGLADKVREFIDWYAPFQCDNGEIPPIIDTKHQDPLWEEKQGLHEFDGQGEFVHLLLEHYLFARDTSFLRKHYPRIVGALGFLQRLREQRATPEYRDDPEKRVFYNILPASRSHEGYGLAHSYWDDFWALRGWKDGKQIADILGDEARAAWMQTEYEELRRGVQASIALVMERHHIDYAPGCAEKADYDPSATAAAIVACDELDALPEPVIRRSFDKYCDELRRRRQPGAQYVFTPYETRIIGALLRLGRKQEALQLLRFLLACRRPAAWCHLAEVIHCNPRFPCYLGDMPHTWVGAELISAIRMVFAYERGDALALGAGLDPLWLDGERTIAVENLPTQFGRISYEVTRSNGRATAWVRGDAAPPGGLAFASPLDAPPAAIRVNGQAQTGALGEARFAQLPAEIVFTYDANRRQVT